MNIYFDKDYNLLIIREEQEDKTNFVYVDNYIELVSLFGLTIINNKEKEISNLKPNFYKWNLIMLKQEEMNSEEKEEFLKVMKRKSKEFLTYTQDLMKNKS